MTHATSLILLGGGGHAVVVAEAARAAGFGLRGLYDDNPRCAACQPPDPLEHLGPLDPCPAPDTPWILALGALAARRRLLDRLTGHPATDLVAHPSAVISPTAALGKGVFLAPASVVHSRAAVGAHAIINTAAVVEHDCRVGANAHLAPRATLGGTAAVGDDTLVGIGAVIFPGVRVGDRCTIGAGAVVHRDVPDDTTVVGNPAKPLL